mgnify:CR=1 FL=1
MDTKKLLMGTVVGGIAYFFLGWIIYGMALMSTMAEYSNAACMRAETDMVWWALILSCFASAALITSIFLKAGNVSSFGSGAQLGAMISFLVSVSVDLGMYSMMTTFTDPTGIVIDVVAATVIGAVVGGIIAIVIGRGSSQPAA